MKQDKHSRFNLIEPRTCHKKTIRHTEVFWNGHIQLIELQEKVSHKK